MTDPATPSAVESKPSQSSPASPNDPLVWIGAAVLAVIGCAQAGWIWGKTGDLFIDFGNDLYIAWRVSHGQVLLRDVGCLFGPLSPYFNGFVMFLFGADVRVILAVNLILLGIVVAMIYALARAAAGTIAGFIVAAFFLSSFGLSSPTMTTNYNFLTPYSQQITHGFILCIAALWCLDRFNRTQKMVWAAGLGLASGLVFLTKPELFVACLAMAVGGWAGIAWIRRKIFLKQAIVALGMMLLPALVSILLFLLTMPLHDAVGATVGAWKDMGNSAILQTPFYRTGLGIDDVPRSLGLLAYCNTIYAAILAGFAAAALVCGKFFSRSPAVAVLVAAIAGAFGYWIVPQPGRFNAGFSTDMFRGLPVFAAAVAIVAAIRIFMARGKDSAIDSTAGRPMVLIWALSLLSLALLSKIILNVRCSHYGFVLAAPCAMLAVIALVRWLPAWIQKMGGAALVMQLGAVGLILGVAVNRLALTQEVFSQRTMVVPLAMGGSLRADPNTDIPSVNAVRWARNLSGTLTVFPDATGINFAAAKINPIHFNLFAGLSVAMEGEANIVAELDRHPPDVILIMAIDDTAYGGRYFGFDYALDILKWIRANYQPVQRFVTPQGYPLTAFQHQPS
jgi:hypothetical protein